MSIIVGASSDTCPGDAIISLWTHKIIRERRTKELPLTWSSLLVVTLQIAMMIAAAGFIYQNIELGVSCNTRFN
jgi:hypothetical protein